MKRAVSSTAFALAVCLCAAAADPPPKRVPQTPPTKYAQLPVKDDVAQYLQDISVTIRAGNVEGSGVLSNINGVNYVLTAGHVVAGLRTARPVVDPTTGASKTEVRFEDAQVIKDLIENGRTVGSLQFQAEVLRYSDSEHGDDLALLRVRKKDLMPGRVHFYLEDKIPAVGTELYHVGSLLGQDGSNSMTSGILSQQGRVLLNTTFDQTTCPAFPGSSGGGVYLKDGHYVGMLVRGAGETFNLIVPVRRIRSWAKKVGVDFVLDPSLLVPSDEELRKRPIEDTPGGRAAAAPSEESKKFGFLIRKVEK